MAAELLRPVSLIVLAWNRWALTERCLETLKQTDLDGAEVLVVDNGSTDETPQRLAALDWIRIVTLPRNLGYTRGNNAGLDAVARDRDVVLLNNDLIFTQRDWLQRLRRCARAQPAVGVVGCRLRMPEGDRLLHAGTYVLPDTCWSQQIGSLEKDIGQFTSTRAVDGIVFACAYLTREVIAAVGGLSTDFESYCEDTDYCLRARDAGFKTLLCGEVTLVHDEHGSTRDIPEVFTPLFARSRETFRKKWASRLAERYEYSVLWQSILNVPSGYATSCREILQALEAEGVRTAYRYLYGPGTVYPIPEVLPSTRDHLLQVVRARDRQRRPPIAVAYGQGDMFAANAGRRRIGYTMLEVDGFPASWVRQANRMDEVWVPSEFNRQGFLRSGLTRPAYVVPLGVNAEYFHPDGAAYPNPAGEFIFLTSFEWGARKAAPLLLQAFSETFSAAEPVRLVCKIINRDKAVSVKSDIRSLGLASSGGRMSFLLNLDFPYSQLPALYRSAHCYVNTSRGEGWNLPLMEAMACGLPAIATDWGGQTEFFHAGVGYPLRVRDTIPAVARCPYYDGFRWADPDPDHLRHLLRHVFEHREEAAALGAAAAREIAARWTWGRTARIIRDRLRAAGA